MGLNNGVGFTDGRYPQKSALFQQTLGLKRFRDALQHAGQREIVVRLLGTSIEANSFGPTAVFVEALQQKYGQSRSQFMSCASNNESPVNGWPSQYYSGPFTIRLRANSSGTTPLVYQYRSSSVTIYYSTETDGGSFTVTVNGVAQTPVSCNGAQSMGNAVTYSLPPGQISTVSIAAPASGYAYMEGVLFKAPTLNGQRGIRLDNLAYGGSALKHMFDPTERVAANGSMAPSQVVVGNNGVNATFAPTDAGVKPDLVIFGGTTNDIGLASQQSAVPAYQSLLNTAVAAAINNGSDLMFLQEPANGGSYAQSQGGSASPTVDPVATDAGLSSGWSVCRTAIQQTLTQWPDFTGYADWDYALRFEAYAYRYHNQATLSDPHPHPVGWGDPDWIGASVMCAMLALPLPTRTYPSPENLPRNAAYVTQSTEPTYLPPGSYWEDTSNGTGINAVLKQKVATLDDYTTPVAQLAPQTAWSDNGNKGLWRVVSGNPGAGIYPTLGDKVISSTWTAGTTANGTIPTASIVDANPMQIFNWNLVPGNTYTLSFNASVPNFATLYPQYPAVVSMSLSLKIGQANAVSLDPSTGLFTTTPTLSSIGINPIDGDWHRVAITFTWPSQAQLTALANAGTSPTNILALLINPPNNSGTIIGPVNISQLQIDPGASALVAPVGKTSFEAAPTSTLLPLAGVTQATEPLVSSGYNRAGLSWVDSSNSGTPIAKQLWEPGSVTPLTTVLDSGTSLWRITSGSSPDLLAAGIAGGGAFFQSTSNGTGTYLAGSNYYGVPVSGFTWTNATNSGGTAGIQTGVTDVPLGAQLYYTYSALVRVDMAAGNAIPDVAPSSLTVAFWALNPAQNINLYLNSDQLTWGSGGKVINSFPSSTQVGKWMRISFKFKSYTSAQLTALLNGNGSSAASFMALWRIPAGYVLTVADARLQLGQSVSF